MRLYGDLGRVCEINGDIFVGGEWSWAPLDTLSQVNRFM